jgi:hypothetical protein
MIQVVALLKLSERHSNYFHLKSFIKMQHEDFLKTTDSIMGS